MTSIIHLRIPKNFPPFGCEKKTGLMSTLLGCSAALLVHIYLNS